MTNTELNLKRKILGVLMKNARNRVGLNRQETATLLGISDAQLANYEFGRAEAGLPVLEGLARVCNVPLDYFWSEEAVPQPDRNFAAPKAIGLRRKMIGILLAKARAEAGLSKDKVAQFLDCSAEQVANYELGKTDLSLSQLQSLTDLLGVESNYFFNGNGKSSAAAEPDSPLQPAQEAPVVASPVESKQIISEEDLAELTELSPEIKEFLKDPSNMLYVKLAMKLHGLSTHTLRALAEGILDITY